MTFEPNTAMKTRNNDPYRSYDHWYRCPGCKLEIKTGWSKLVDPVCPDCDTKLDQPVGPYMGGCLRLPPNTASVFRAAPDAVHRLE